VKIDILYELDIHINHSATPTFSAF